MTTESSSPTTDAKPKKKFYSKLGCRECKRRKIKCDETKPACLKCSRLDKVCVYPKLGEKVLRVSKKFLAHNGGLDATASSAGAKSDNEDHRAALFSQINNQINSAISPPPQTLTHPHQLQPPHSLTQASLSSLHAESAIVPPVGHPQPLASSGSPQLSVPTTRVAPIHPHPTTGAIPPPQSSPSGPPLSSAVSAGTSGPSTRGAVSSQLNHTFQSFPSANYNMSAPLPGHAHSPPQLFNSTFVSTAGSSTDAATVATPTDTPSTAPALAAFHPSIKYKPTSSYILNSANSPSDQGSTRIESPMSKTSNSSGQDQNPVATAVNTDDSFNLRNDALFDVYFNREDLDLLASDLNNLVGSIMVESNFDKKPDDFDAASSESNSTILNTQATPPSIPIMRSMYSSDHNSIPRNIPYHFIRLSSTHEKYYLEQFYNDFSSVIMPFLPYDELVGGYFNPARDIVIFCASKEPFLLAALLAQGAKVAHNKTNMPKYEESYCNYLAKCLKLLGPALNDESQDRSSSVYRRNNSKKKLASNIESVLLTVLILTSSNASNTKQNWRPHLKGAKDLLMKYAVHSDLKGSKALIFCKTWYVSFELLAALSSKKGGTLQNDNEIGLIMKLDEPDVVRTLREIGIISETGFNYMFGFHHSLLPHIKGLIKLLNASRKGSLEATTSFNHIQLLSDFYQTSKFHFINEKNYLSPKDLGDEKPKGLLLDCIKVKNNDVYINWMDLAHRAYCYAGMLTVLTKGFGLPFDHHQVKPITTKLIDSMVVLKDVPTPAVGCKPLMIQWPMLVGGLNCFKEEHKSIVQQFFRISGSGSAGFSIHVIDKVWNKHRNNKFSSDDSDLDIDTVTY